MGLRLPFYAQVVDRAAAVTLHDGSEVYIPAENVHDAGLISIEARRYPELETKYNPTEKHVVIRLRPRSKR